MTSSVPGDSGELENLISMRFRTGNELLKRNAVFTRLADSASLSALRPPALDAASYESTVFHHQP